MADEKTPNYNAEERDVLKCARLFRDLIATEGWIEYQKMLDAQLASRSRILATPLDALPSGEFQQMDFVAKAAKMESVKGAIIGLTLARSLPELTIQSASDIVKEHSLGEEE